MLEYGWFYSSYFSIEFIECIHSEEDNLSQKQIDEKIISYFSKENYLTLEEMIASWSELVYFKCRERIFYESLQNHRNGYFNSSITLLTLHIEGIFIDFVRFYLKEPTKHVKDAISKVESILNSNQEIEYDESRIFDDIINTILNIIYAKFELNAPDATPNNSRHKIAHGQVFEKEIEKNSLNQFLYLNEIYNLLRVIIENSTCENEILA